MKHLNLLLSVFSIGLLMNATTGNIAYAAGGAFIVDNTDLVDPGSCQVETWVGTATNSDRKMAVAPGCTLAAFPHAEASITFERERENKSWATYATPTLKTRILPKEVYGLGFGMNIGTRYDFTDSRSDSTNITGLFSLDPTNAVTLNANLGYERDHKDRNNHAIWGVGTDIDVTDRTDVILEVFGSSNDDQKTGFQAGLRPHFMNGNANIDLIVGRNVHEANTNWFTIGGRIGF